jgi:uncharacterized membrane protein (UPF0127 family)
MRRRAFLACAAAGLAGCQTGDRTTPTQAAEGNAGAGPENGDANPDADTDSGADTAPGGTDVATDRTPTATDGTPADATRSPTPTTSSPTPTQSPRPPALAGYDTTEVRATTPGGERLGRVRAAVSDTSDLRYTGLSKVEHLPEDWGMLFVYDSVGGHTYVMRDMDFGLDIVYADDRGVITEVHHAPAPGPDEDGESQQYPGTGQYVFEVNEGWTTEHGVETGDVLRFEL